MKSAQINRYGGSEVILMNEYAKLPSTSKGQVLIEIYAASINPIDWKVREGYLKEFVLLKFPITLGTDFSGKIIEIGEGVKNYKVGDEIFGSASVLSGGSGSFSEVALAEIKNIAIKPKISHREAASLPLAGTSAYQALIEHIDIEEGQKILIHGGSGGIGSIAIQIAKHMKAYVASTASKENIDFVKSLGADEVIDYKNEKFEEKLKEYDAVFDTVGGKTYENSFKVLKKKGIIVSMNEKPNETLMNKHEVNAIYQSTELTNDKLRNISKLIDDKIIKPQVGKIFDFKNINEAFDYAEKSHNRGKVVIKIKNV